LFSTGERTFASTLRLNLNAVWCVYWCYYLQLYLRGWCSDVAWRFWRPWRLHLVPQSAMSCRSLELCWHV
jgi:hypothetical protein